jgi:hypothetical protein
MYMSGSGQFASTTYYMQATRPGSTAFNAAKPADRYFRAEWKPVLPEAAYARSLPDGQPWGRRAVQLPMRMGGAKDDTDARRASTAPAAQPVRRCPVAGLRARRHLREQLGPATTCPTCWSVSLSGHDYVNHAWSAESRFSHDHLLQLDRLLQDFFRDLDASVGRDNYIAVLSADHGFTPAPEYNANQGRESGRINGSQVLGRVNAGLEKRFGEGKWAVGFSGSSVLLNKQLIAQKKADADALAEETRALLMAEPGFAAAYTRRELQSGSRAGAPFFEQIRKSWHLDVSGDVQYSPRPGWMFGNTVATHGSPHPYDTQVPILVYGPAWVKPGRIDARVEVVDIAPTLSRVLRIAPPSSAEGKLLPLPGL